MARVIERNPYFDVAAVRADFPALHQTVHGHPLAYLDNAASAQCPQAVIDAVAQHRSHDHSNVHRGVHELSERSTRAYEGARDKLRSFLNAAQREHVDNLAVEVVQGIAARATEALRDQDDARIAPVVAQLFRI